MSETIQDIAEEEKPVKVVHNVPSLNKRIEKLEANTTTSVEEDIYAVMTGRIQNLEDCLVKMAHYNGGANERILREFGINTYTLKAGDMSKVS